MASVMKTLLLNPPSFDKFDGGAGSRWQAAREAEAFWYPTWLAYAAGMLEGSRLLDAPPAHITPEQTIQIARGFDFVVLFTSTVGFESDVRIVRSMKEAKPDLKVAFVGPPVQVRPTESLMASADIDFVVRGEFDHPVVEFAQGKPLAKISGVSFRRDGFVVHNPARPSLTTEELDRLPFATEVYKRDLVIENYNMPFLQYPYVSLYTSRGCPAVCTFCLWPQTLSGHALFAYGRRRFPAMPGAYVPRTMWWLKSARRSNYFPRPKSFFSTTILSTSAGTACWSFAENSSPSVFAGRVIAACIAITKR
jgi:hypothetical protein